MLFCLEQFESWDELGVARLFSRPERRPLNCHGPASATSLPPPPPKARIKLKASMLVIYRPIAFFGQNSRPSG